MPRKMDFYEALSGANETLGVIKRSVEEAKKHHIKNTPSLHLMLMCASAIAEKHQAKIVLLGLLPENYSKRQKLVMDKLILKSLQILNSTVSYDVSFSVCANPAQELIRLSSGFDLLILGKEPERRQNKNLEKSFSFHVSNQLECSSIIVKSINPVKMFVQRL